MKITNSTLDKVKLQVNHKNTKKEILRYCASLTLEAHQNNKEVRTVGKMYMEAMGNLWKEGKENEKNVRENLDMQKALARIATIFNTGFWGCFNKIFKLVPVVDLKTASEEKKNVEV